MRTWKLKKLALMRELNYSRKNNVISGNYTEFGFDSSRTIVKIVGDRTRPEFTNPKMSLLSYPGGRTIKIFFL